jgi:hypothetical protein
MKKHMKTGFDDPQCDNLLLEDGELPANVLASYPADERTMVPSRTQPMEWLIMFMIWLICISVIIGTAVIPSFVASLW